MLLCYCADILYLKSFSASSAIFAVNTLTLFGSA